MKKTIKILSTAMLISGSVSSVFGSDDLRDKFVNDRTLLTANTETLAHAGIPARDSSMAPTIEKAKRDAIAVLARLDADAQKLRDAAVHTGAGAPAGHDELMAELYNADKVKPLPTQAEIAGIVNGAERLKKTAIVNTFTRILHGTPGLETLSDVGNRALLDTIVKILAEPTLIKDVVHGIAEAGTPHAPVPAVSGKLTALGVSVVTADAISAMTGDDINQDPLGMLKTIVEESTAAEFVARRGAAGGAPVNFYNDAARATDDVLGRHEQDAIDQELLIALHTFLLAAKNLY